MDKQKIVHTLKNEHQEIVNILSQANKGNGFPDEKWRIALLRAKELFEHHLDYEDETLYHDSFFNGNVFGDYPETAKKFQEEMSECCVSSMRAGGVIRS